MTEGRRPGPTAIRRALAELLTLDDIAAVMEWSPASAAKYRQRPEPSGLPEPDATIGRTPVWFRVTIERWREQRPGRGAGGGRPRGWSPARTVLPAEPRYEGLTLAEGWERADDDEWLADQPSTDAPQSTPRRNGKATAREAAREQLDDEGAGE